MAPYMKVRFFFQELNMNFPSSELFFFWKKYVEYQITFIQEQFQLMCSNLAQKF